MHYISTRGSAPHLNFEDTMLTGLAKDGGLYVPETIPTLSPDEIRAMRALPYEEIAFRVMKPFIGDTFCDSDFQDIIEKAYAGFGHSALAPLVQLEQNHFLLELFHGPTLAFKDFAMQLIGQMFQVGEEFITNWKAGDIFSFDWYVPHATANCGYAPRDVVTIVGATSGDTGSAAIEAFRGLDAVDVFILFPDGRVSEVQRRQMTTPSEANVHALAVEGTFDDCQNRLKDMFNDFAFRDAVRLAGVNSINWARVLAQVVYYFSSAVSLGAPDRSISFTVPTGNFGDIFAGYIAKRMGLSIDKLVIATNQNDILHRCLTNGAYEQGTVLPSISPSMDIQISSNFERALFDAYERDGAAVAALMEEFSTTGRVSLSQGIMKTLKQHFTSGSASEAATLSTIKRIYAETGELLCPHSAIGVYVAEQNTESQSPMVTLATAHPAKFPSAVEQASGLHPPLPARMSDLYDRTERVTRIENDLSALEALIKERIAS